MILARFGPEFQGSRSILYRTEYGVLTIALLAYLIWRGSVFGGIDWFHVVFWAIFPDLGAFIPIGLSSQRKTWPPWGAGLYNFFHTILIWGVAFLAAWIALGAVYWPLIGWLGHITADRAMGYGLRSTSNKT